MAESEFSPGQLIEEWWYYFQPDKRSNFHSIESGMRKEVGPPELETIEYEGGVRQPVTHSQRQLGACQYWIKGLPAVCGYWSYITSKCTSPYVGTDAQPTGYGSEGRCDMLGRRDWCTGYMPLVDADYEEFVCVAPCMERSGLGKQIGTDKLKYRPFLPSEIVGYNPDDDGVGRCDGWGMGRGDTEESYASLNEVVKHMPICRHYRPQEMGFGAISPRPFHGSEKPAAFDRSENWIPKTIATIHDGSRADPLEIMPIRLPFAFQVYNARAMFQKCAHWNSSSPSFFVIDDYSDPSLYSIGMNDESYCTCDDDDLCDPYRNESDIYYNSAINYVVAPYGGIICNGAKPECPCYTGKWIYCTDNRMRDGMRIGANQILELRFWASNWATQDEYDEYYLQKPGRTVAGAADESTSDIYTFLRWEKKDDDNPNLSQMKGTKHSMCMPAPLHMKEFTPSDYVTKEVVEYDVFEKFTGTNVQGGNVTFPTLVRELEDPTNYVPDIEVIYPYNTINPWKDEPCNESKDDKPDFCIHNTNLMQNPYVTVIGQCTAKKSVYVINTTLCDIGSSNSRSAMGYMEKYIRAMQVPSDKWDAYNDAIKKFIESCEEYGTGFVELESSGSGLFTVGSELKNNTDNVLYVICRYKQDELDRYTYRKLKVKSLYWGALIEERSAIHEHEGDVHYNNFPYQYYPGNSITGNVETIRGEVDSVLSVFGYLGYGLYESKIHFSYCINQYEKTEEDVINWVRIGSTGYIWAEIDDLDVSYVWPFKAIEAKMKYIGKKDDKQKPGLCGQEEDEEEGINLTVVFPTSFDEKLPRKSVPPTAVLLKAEKPLSFFNSDWKLTIKYQYNKIENEQKNCIWPIDGVFVSNPYNIIHSKGSKSFSINGIVAGSVKVMALVTDEDGRVQTAAATKMVVQGYDLSCRSLEIEYKYHAEATGYFLQPLAGMMTWRGAPGVLSKTQGHYRAANCGDHGTLFKPQGPMWFPFNDCTAIDFYNVLNGAAQCTMAISEGEDVILAMGNGGYRYSVADEYRAWVDKGGNWLASCGASFKFYYSKAGLDTMRFTGKAKLKDRVNKLWYMINDWTLPPFGNQGRGYVERYLSRDFSGYVDLSGPRPVPRAEYMPMVFDREDFFMDLNCFSQEDMYSSIGDPFSSFPILSTCTAHHIAETVSETRYRFEDIIQPIKHANCMYPYPLIPVSNTVIKVVRYGFLNEDHVWAWPEWWKHIERNVESTDGKFNFVELYKPDYYFDQDKDEHRIITDEGTHKIMFNPPMPGGEDSNATYPSISIDGNYPRFFQVTYDSYSASKVTWKDESEDGQEGGSSGGNIYEEANNGKDENGEGAYDPLWIHPFDMLFDGNSSSDITEDRMAYLGKDIDTGEKFYGYYNRGIVAYIPKNRLKFLPMKVYNADSPAGDSTNDDESEILYYWFSGNFGEAPVKITLCGYCGVNVSEENSPVYSRPGINVAESKEDISGESEVEWPEDAESVGRIVAETGVGTELDTFEIELELDRLPERFTTTWEYFIVKLSSIAGEKLSIDSIKMELGKYVKAEEEVKVWERKYYVGESASSAPNADGPNTRLYRSYDRDRKNAGQYYPFVGSTSDAGEVKSKLTVVNFGEHHHGDIDIDVTLSDLKYTEEQAQREPYDEAYNLDNYDTLNFSGFMPPAIDEWLKEIGAVLRPPRGFMMTYKKIDWQHNYVRSHLRQEGDFWQPGGHYFIWSENARRTRCYMTGPVQDVYDADWVHHRHGGAVATAWTGHSFTGFVRLEYYEGRLWQMGLTGDYSGLGQRTDSLTGAVNFLYTT